MADQKRKGTSSLTPSPRPATAAPRPVKDDEIRVRISGEQKAALIAAATREGLELSAWLRQLALRAAGVLPPK